jgi:hypothetical protein
MMRRLMILALALAVPPGHAWEQDIGSEGPSYCSDLQRVTSLAMTRERAAIAGKPREGNFLETSLALTGWNNCALTAPRPIPAIPPRSTARKTRSARRRTSCGKSRPASVKDGPKRPSARRPTMWSCTTRSARFPSRTDQTDDSRHVVHLNVFVRRN